MTRRLFLSALLAVFLAYGQPPQEKRAPQPKLVLVVVIDQFRYDYLTRFEEDYSGGIARLVKSGAVFTNARYMHVPTYTAIGHATITTGAYPYASGIVGNDWFDRESGKPTGSVTDESVKQVGGNGGGVSPRLLMVSTVGDEMKMAERGKPKVIGISLKDRAAILPAGHMADAAYWFDEKAGNWVTSSFYMEDLPGWVKEYNATRPADKFAGAPWRPIVPQKDGSGNFNRKLVDTVGRDLYSTIEVTPFGNDLLEAFAERVMEAEQLGMRSDTDLLTVSFSSIDYIGHGYGPNSPEVRDGCLRLDRAMGKFLDFVDSKLGLGNVLLVLTADHGVAPHPDWLQRNKMPGGRLPSASAAIQARLTERYGAGQWVLGMDGLSPYLNFEQSRKKRISDSDLLKTAAEIAMQSPHIYRVYTREQLLAGVPPGDEISLKVVNSFHPRRSPDLIVVEEPYWMASSQGTTHGAPWGYDSHVPVIFSGPGIKPGRYHATITPNDIAPTLATMLAVETPSGSAGRVLAEAFAGR